MPRRFSQDSWKQVADDQLWGEYEGVEEYVDNQSSICVQDETLSTHAWERCLPGHKCVLQHVVEDWGYEREGWFVLVNYESKSAVIASFDEKSYFSSQTGMCCDNFIWQGLLETLLTMAVLRRDPSFPKRQMLPEDTNYQHWCCLYEGLCAWAQFGCPDWSGTSRWGPDKGTSVWIKKTPFAVNLTQMYKRQSHAATVIQAAWRGWAARMFVLWNPHTDIGKRRLAAEASRATSMM